MELRYSKGAKIRWNDCGSRFASGSRKPRQVGIEDVLAPGAAHTPSPSGVAISTPSIAAVPSISS
jgi:hypothetical protein